MHRLVSIVVLAVLAAGLSALRAAAASQQAPPDIQVNPLPQARQLAAPAPAQARPLSPRTKELAERLRAATQAVRANAQQKTAAQAKVREDRHAAVKALRARVGPSLKLRFRDRDGTPSLVSGKPLHAAAKGAPPGTDRDVATAKDFLRTNRMLFGLEDPDRELTLKKKQQDALNRTHLRFEQSYKGVPIWPSELLVHLDPDGNVDRANGSPIRTPKQVSTTPIVDKERAKRLAREALDAPEDAEATDPILIIYTSDDQPPKLAWKLEVPLGLAADWLVVIDAHSGTVLTKFNQVTDASVPASGVDLFGVTREISAWEENGVYYLIDASKPMFDGSQSPVQNFGTPGAIYVVDAANTPADPYTQKPDLDWVRAFDSPLFDLPDAVSAMHSLSAVYSYYLDYHGRNSIDGQGGPIVAVVRVGFNYPNAFKLDERLYFGDGDTYSGALDVVAHELTHAVIGKSSRLVYQNQSGALNEAFSDIFGEMVEARTDGAPDWLMGTQLDSPSRSLQDPSLFGQPSTMSEFIEPDDPLLENYVGRDNGGVHINSGIINHAYYLLAEGLPGAIGIADAEQIFYRALTEHLIRDAKFIDARRACIAAAEELFGAGSTQAAKVGEAFDAVEIFDDAPSAPPESFPEIDAPDSTLFIFFDADAGDYRLGRRESALGDGELGTVLATSPSELARPAASGDGAFAVFVDATLDACLFDTNDSTTQECAGFPGSFYSIAMSPQGNQYAVVLLDEFGEPGNMISIVDVENPANDRDIILRAPLIDGGGAVQVDSAEAMAFSSDGRWLFYDAWNEIDIGDGLTFGTWSIYAIDLTTDLILPVVPPQVGFDFAYPALSKTSDNFLVFDVYDLLSETSWVSVMNLFTGELRLDIGLVIGSYGVPTFAGDDAAIVYSYPADTVTGYSLARQSVNPSTMTPVGDPTVWLEDADFGVIYRRGAFQAPSETDDCPDDPNKTEAGICGCGVPDTDADGDSVADCFDQCPSDPAKSEPGLCGCGLSENACAVPAPSGTCGAGMGVILLALPVLGMLRFMPRRKQSRLHERRSRQLDHVNGLRQRLLPEWQTYVRSQHASPSR